VISVSASLANGYLIDVCFCAKAYISGPPSADGEHYVFDIVTVNWLDRDLYNGVGSIDHI